MEHPKCTTVRLRLKLVVVIVELTIDFWNVSCLLLIFVFRSTDGSLKHWAVIQNRRAMNTRMFQTTVTSSSLILQQHFPSLVQMLLRGKKKFKVKWRAIRTTAIPKNPPMSEIHMLVRFRVLLPSAGSSPITPYFPARSADQNLEFFSLAWILGKQMPGQTVQFTQGQDSLGEQI